MKVPKLFQRKTVQKGFLTKLSGKSSLGVYKYRYPILLLFVIITVLFSLTYTSIKSQSDYTTYFPDEEPLVQDLKYIMKNFAGVQRLNLTITAPESSKNYFLNPDNLKAITELEQVIERKEDVLKVMSFPGIIEDLNLLMSGQKEIPQSRGLVLLLSRYTKALSGSMESGLSNILINEDHSRINLTIMIRNSESHTFLSEEGLRELIYSIEIEAHKHLETELYFDIWGFDMEYLDLAEAVARDQRLSTILSIGVILLMTTILFRSLTMGLMTLIPLFSGLMLNSLFMILFQIPLDITTMMVSSVAIGVGVDDAVHYMLQFRQQRKLFSSPQKIFYNCATISGRPIILTTISIVGGLISLTLASFKGIVYFGALVSITLASTMIGTLILLPALLAILMDMKNSVLPAAKFSRR